MLNEKVLSGKHDPEPPKSLYWDEAGIKNETLKNGYFVSDLVSSLEVVYINTEVRTAAEAETSFTLKFK